MEATLITVLVSIIVVIIPACVSFYGLKITTQNKMSEIRQTWIDELRKDISDYIGFTQEYAFYYRHIRNKQDKQEKNDGPENNSRNLINEHFSKNSHIVDSLYTRIVLRLGSANHEDMLEMLDDSYKDYFDMLNNDNYHADLSDHLAQLRNRVVTVLDKAWETVKKGEQDIERIIKFIPYLTAGIVIFIMLFVFGIHSLRLPPSGTETFSCQCDKTKTH
ncbi:MAG: hypothetical protein ABSA46_11030 [Thermodesulfovibrionales bacterium]|jgi:hypothetical protein